MPYKDKEKEREWRREYRESHRESINKTSLKHQHKYRKLHKEQGLCRYCCREITPSRVYCLKHLIISRLAQRRYRIRHSEQLRIKCSKNYYKYKEEGRCTDCGMPLSITDSTGLTCVNCKCRDSLPKRRVNAINYQTAT